MRGDLDCFLAWEVGAPGVEDRAALEDGAWEVWAAGVEDHAACEDDA